MRTCFSRSASSGSWMYAAEFLLWKQSPEGFCLQLFCCEVLKPRHKGVTGWLCSLLSCRHPSNKQQTSFTLCGKLFCLSQVQERRWLSPRAPASLSSFFFFPFSHSLRLWGYFRRHRCSCCLKHALCPPCSLSYRSLHFVGTAVCAVARWARLESWYGGKVTWPKKKGCSWDTCVISQTALLSPGEGCQCRDEHLWVGKGRRG